jgi:uncharacterized protein (DUF305 family)
MYGKREILNVDLCQKHLLSLTSKTLEQIAQDIIETQKKEVEQDLTS